VHRPLSVLALDTGSPTVSVAVAILEGNGRGAPRLAERSIEIGRSSRRLLGMIDETLAEAGIGIGELGGLVALAGPGSFTGLSIGLATTLGLHQATGVPAMAVPTLEVLALAGAATSRPGAGAGSPIVAAVDVLRGEWAVQEYPPRGEGEDLVATGPAERTPAAELARRWADGEAVRVIGFGVDGFAAELGTAGSPPHVELVEPPPLAAVAARRAIAGPWHGWDGKTLTAPIYFRPPAVTLPRPRR
jgi:tRNA threonylcarbamoyladenosine biosynthesis protein TsaB